jgi:hypothetical protein
VLLHEYGPAKNVRTTWVPMWVSCNDPTKVVRKSHGPEGFEPAVVTIPVSDLIVEVTLNGQNVLSEISRNTMIAKQIDVLTVTDLLRSVTFCDPIVTDVQEFEKYEIPQHVKYKIYSRTDNTAFYLTTKPEDATAPAWKDVVCRVTVDVTTDKVIEDVDVLTGYDVVSGHITTEWHSLLPGNHGGERKCYNTKTELFYV